MGEKTIGWGAALDAARGSSNNSNVQLMLERYYGRGGFVSSLVELEIAPKESRTQLCKASGF